MIRASRHIAFCLTLLLFTQTISLGLTQELSDVSEECQPGFSSCVVYPEFEKTSSVEVAHAEDGNIEFTSSMVAGHVDQIAHSHDPTTGGLSDSLYVNMVLFMAYQRDPELLRIAKKSSRLGTFGTLSALALSGLGVASSVFSLATINAGSGGHSEEEHSEEEHSTERDSPTASIIGVIGSGLSVVALGSQMYFRHRFQKQAQKRQGEVLKKVEHAVATLDTAEGTREMEELIGVRATKEFKILTQK